MTSHRETQIEIELDRGREHVAAEGDEEEDVVADVEAVVVEVGIAHLRMIATERHQRL